MPQTDHKTQPNSHVDKLEYAINLAKAGRKKEAHQALRKIVALQPVNQAAWLWLSALATERAEAEAALAQARKINPAHSSLRSAEQWLIKRFAPQPHTKVRTVVEMAAQSGPPEREAMKSSPESTGQARHPTQAHHPTETSTQAHITEDKIAEEVPPSQPQKPQTVQTVLDTQTKESEIVEPPPLFSVLSNYGHLFGLYNKLSLGLVIFAVLIGLTVLFLGLGLELNATAQSYRLIQNQSLAAAEPTVDFDRYQAELKLAEAERNWPKAIAILEALHRAEPDSQMIGEQLAQAYLQNGITLRHKGYIEQAVPAFEQALALTPYRLRAQHEHRLASNYLEGTRQYQAGHWQEAIKALEMVRAEADDYVNVNDLLYSAYYNHGLAQKAVGDLSQARDAFEAAIMLRPDLAEPRLKIAELEYALAPETPPDIPISTVSAKNQFIVVGIAEQRMQVYEAGRKVFDFVVSTGEPGRDTAIGEFEILDKIDVAYASTWNLDMPYWMGIYWSGPLENGIHGLPTVKHTGYKLWDGYLGQRVSYGCIILGDEDVVALYEWVQVGAKVKIVPSLADWSLEEEQE
jgi:lipoprotein-anchoring transpeptidase ErfK/SrfK